MLEPQLPINHLWLHFRKLEATSGQNIEFLQIIAKREESIHQAQLRLEEKTRECGSLARQLEMAIDDAKKQVGPSLGVGWDSWIFFQVTEELIAEVVTKRRLW